MQVVGITGYKRSGKGEVANILSADCTVGVVYQIGFADKVKQLAARALGLEGGPRDLIAMMDGAKLRRDLGGWTISVDKPSAGTFQIITGRNLQQNVGTEARILLGEDLWVDQVLPRTFGLGAEALQLELGFMYPDIDVLAITDLRFENEARRVRDVGGVVWEVTRPGAESDGHASEQALPRDLVDWQIVNDGTLDDLRCRVEDAIHETLN